MDSEKNPVERRLRNAIVLFFGIFFVCTIIASLLTGLPSNMEWAGISVSLAIATIGTVAGVAGCLCFVILIELNQRRS